MTQPTSVVIPVYDGVTQLDFTGPHQFLSRTPDLHVRVASLGGQAVTADRLTFSNLEDLKAIESCDVVLVPGGGGCLAAIENDLFVKEIARLGATARYLTSVCTGSLILGAAGFLAGRRAACHWAWRELLPIFGAVVDESRIVRDGNILSGGGVTAGIDFVLALIAELRGSRTAEMVQLGLEYAPEPPFNSGRPDTAPPEVLEAVNARTAASRAERRVRFDAWAAAHRAGQHARGSNYARPPGLSGHHQMERDMSGSERPGFSTALAVGRELGLKLPDNQIVRDAYAQADAESQPWLFNHVVRSWLYGAKLTQYRGLTPDAELVAVSVLLHDLGLARGGAPDRRFEIVGADIGRAFALSHNMGERRAETVWDSIALHTTASIAQHKSTDVACCQNGIACDYGGLGYNELTDDDKKVILSAYPRLGMKNELTTWLCGIAKTHANTTRDNFIADFGMKYVPGYTRPSSVDFLHQSPFAE